MKTFLLLLLGFVLGGIVGVVGGGAIGTGLGAGVGIATGLEAGACLTVESAKDKGLISADQVEQIFAAAAETMKAEADIGDETAFADSDAECQAVVAKLKHAIAERDAS